MERHIISSERRNCLGEDSWGWLSAVWWTRHAGKPSRCETPGAEYIRQIHSQMYCLARKKERESLGAKKKPPPIQTKKEQGKNQHSRKHRNRGCPGSKCQSQNESSQNCGPGEAWRRPWHVRAGGVGTEPEALGPQRGYTRHGRAG